MCATYLQIREMPNLHMKYWKLVFQEDLVRGRTRLGEKIMRAIEKLVDSRINEASILNVE